MSMNTRGQRILLWTAPPAMALFALAYVLFPVFAPPLSPTLSPEEVAAFFRDHNTGILGVVILVQSDRRVAGSVVRGRRRADVPHPARRAASSPTPTSSVSESVRPRSSSPTTAGG